MNTLIKNGTLVTAFETFQADILIEDEKIVRIGLNLEADSAQVVDATGKLIMPGGVDPHTHFDLPSLWRWPIIRRCCWQTNPRARWTRRRRR